MLETPSTTPIISEDPDVIELKVEGETGAITVADLRAAVVDPEQIAGQEEKILSDITELAALYRESSKNVLEGLVLQLKDVEIPPGKFSEELMKLLDQLTKEAIEDYLAPATQ